MTMFSGSVSEQLISTDGEEADAGSRSSSIILATVALSHVRSIRGIEASSARGIRAVLMVARGVTLSAAVAEPTSTPKRIRAGRTRPE